ncbi:MAG: Rieske 2Fe-2S domain-containing protein [Cyanobacteria bacterium P01_A01_bin.84]
MKPILPGAPWLIAHKSMLGINKSNKITLNGKDYVIWQNSKGEVFALGNICPHMQAPLSNGWICKEKNTITCPFHALEFDGKGRLYQDGEFNHQPLAESLEIEVIGDFIWTYGGFEPKQEIPKLHQKIANNYEFLGIAGEKGIRDDFLNNLLIMYDFNHQNGTHRDLFQIVANKVTASEKEGYYLKVQQESSRAKNSFKEIIGNPVLITIPKILKTTVEYIFPSTIILYGKAQFGNFVQVISLYPETEERTKIFETVFTQFQYPFLKRLLKKSLLKAIDIVVEQDTTAVENLYPKQKSKIKLPNEEIMLYAEQLYHNW